MADIDIARTLWPAAPADIARALIADPHLARLVDAAAAALGHAIVVDPIGGPDVAALAGVKPATVQQWRHRETIPAEAGYIADRPYWHRADVVAWLQTGRRPPGRPRADDDTRQVD